MKFSIAKARYKAYKGAHGITHAAKSPHLQFTIHSIDTSILWRGAYHPRLKKNAFTPIETLCYKLTSDEFGAIKDLRA
jgi:hypothetical protein